MASKGPELKVLIVGGGGREHALAAKLARDAPGATLFAAPGNPGTESVARNLPIADSDIEGLAQFAERERVDLTVVGPEIPLAAGIADVFAERRLPLFGPSGAAARIESSKVFAKTLMRERGIPTAGFQTFRSHADAARYLASVEPPVVVKASGLAGGKGAVVCTTRSEAKAALDEMMMQDRFGPAGREVVIEEFLEGEELSVFFVSDGTDAVPLGTARDHKRRFEGDEGPNTGGMGAYAPVGGLEEDLVERVRREIAMPVLEALAELGTPYRGFLYAGLMLTTEGPKVIEFNCRLGDPEAQVVLPLTSADLLQPLTAVARGETLGDWRPATSRRSALVTVVVCGEYPGRVERGLPIEIPPDLEREDLRIFHAGTALADGRLVTGGGRVLGVTGLGTSLRDAAERSRRGAAAVRFEGSAWRADIGRAELG